MKSHPFPGTLLVLFLTSTFLWSQEQPAQPEAPMVSPEEEAGGTLNSTVFGRAVHMERVVSSVSSTTGMAISPLLGMGVLGVLEYFKATPEERANLPWYTIPWVWGACLGIFLVATLKDTAGIMIPEGIKKPLSVLDVLENKLSGLIVAMAVIPASVAAKMPQEAGDGPSAWLAGQGGPVVAALPVMALPVVFILLLVGIFGVVWLSFHALRCLLLLSPSSFVTSGVKFLKAGFLAGFGLTAYFAPPWLGLAVSALVILGCVLIFGWAFRWSVFGSLFIWDFFLSRFDRSVEEGEALTGFSNPVLAGVKPGTYGEIRRDDEGLVFAYNPWLLFPRREVRIGSADLRTGLRKGLISPALTMQAADADTFATILDFRLRFRSHDDELASRLQVDERQPSRVIQGAKGAITWLKAQIQMGMAPPEQIGTQMA